MLEESKIDRLALQILKNSFINNRRTIDRKCSKNRKSIDPTRFKNFKKFEDNSFFNNGGIDRSKI